MGMDRTTVVLLDYEWTRTRGTAGRDKWVGTDGSTVVLLVDELMGIDGNIVGLRNRDGMDGSTMTLLAGRAVLDTVMVDGHAGWKGVLLVALDGNTVVLI